MEQTKSKYIQNKSNQSKQTKNETHINHENEYIAYGWYKMKITERVKWTVYTSIIHSLFTSIIHPHSIHVKKNSANRGGNSNQSMQHCKHK